MVERTSRREVLEERREKRPETSTEPSEASCERREYRNREVEVEDVCESGML
jgi:hypothetical protein